MENSEQNLKLKSDSELMAYYEKINEELITELFEAIKENQELKVYCGLELECAKDSQVKLDDVSGMKLYETENTEIYQSQKEEITYEKLEDLIQWKKLLEKQIFDLEGRIKIEKNEKQELRMKIHGQQKLISGLNKEIKEKNIIIGILEDYIQKFV